MDSFQAALLSNKTAGLNRLTASKQQIAISPTSDSRPFIQTPAPFPAYPAPGAAAINVLQFTVPQGATAVINKLAIVHVGGGQVDGTGNVIWRVNVNGGFLNGMENMQSQTATFANPNDTAIVLQEGDVITVTAEVPAAQPPMVGTTAARFHGFITPLARGNA